MNAESYERLRAARRREHARRLSDVPSRQRNATQTPSRSNAAGTPTSPLVHVLAKAARELSRRELAAVAWDKMADRRWRAETAVESVKADTIRVTVSSSTVLYELRRKHAALEKELARLVPGVKRLILTIAGEPPVRESEA
jgi:hypothetical protein